MAKENEVKKALRELTEAVVSFENRMDALMEQPDYSENHGLIAKAMNHLSVANQIAMRGGLDYSLPKIEKMYSGVPAAPRPKRVRRKVAPKGADISNDSN